MSLQKSLLDGADSEQPMYGSTAGAYGYGHGNDYSIPDSATVESAKSAEYASSRGADEEQSMYRPSHNENEYGRAQRHSTPGLGAVESCMNLECQTTPYETKFWLKARRCQECGEVCGLIMCAIISLFFSGILLTLFIPLYPFNFLFLFLTFGGFGFAVNAYLKTRHELEVNRTHVRYSKSVGCFRRFKTVLDIERPRVMSVALHEVNVGTKKEPRKINKVGIVLDSGVTFDVLGRFNLSMDAAEADWLILRLRRALDMDVSNV